MRRLALVGVMLAGCSFFGVTPVPSRPAPSEPLACTDTYGWPVFDTLSALSIGGIMGYASYGLSGLQHDCSSGNCSTKGERATGALATGFILSLPWTIGAIVGYVRVSKCASAKRARG